MSDKEKLWHYRLLVALMLITIITLQIAYRNDIIAAVRAVGIQCNVEYSIKIPESEILTIEEIN